MSHDGLFRYELYLLFLIMCFNFIAGFCFGMVLSMLGFTARYVKTPVSQPEILGGGGQLG